MWSDGIVECHSDNSILSAETMFIFCGIVNAPLAYFASDLGYFPCVSFSLFRHVFFLYNVFVFILLSTLDKMTFLVLSVPYHLGLVAFEIEVHRFHSQAL